MELVDVQKVTIENRNALKFKTALNEKEQQIVQMLRELPFEGGETVKDERENTVISILLLAAEYNKCDDVIDIINSNRGKSFNEISQLILKSDIFPPLEIVDDE